MDRRKEVSTIDFNKLDIFLNHPQGRRVHLHLPERRAVPGRVRVGGAPGRLGDHGPGAAHTRILTFTRGNTQLISVNRLVSYK